MSGAVAGIKGGQVRAAVPFEQAARAKPVSVLHLFKHFRPDFTGDGLYLEKLMPLLERRGIRNVVAAKLTRADGPRAASVRLFGHGKAGPFNPFLALWLLANAWRFDVVHLALRG